MPSGPEEVRTSLPLGFLFVFVLAAVVVLGLAVPVGAWVKHQTGDLDGEIAWIEALQAYLPWASAYDAQLDTRYRERVERELRAGRLERAVLAVRAARARTRSHHRPRDPKLMELGLETYTRATDRMERGGNLAAAADWCDTAFVFAVRDADPGLREQAAAAFVEGLELRVRAGRPCEALARVDWAKRGLGGQIPGFDARNEEELRRRCARGR